MSRRPGQIPPINRQPASVDFIDVHLLDQHEAFRKSLAQYDHTAQRYVSALPAPEGNRCPSFGSPTLAEKPMKFWSSIFPNALSRFVDLHPGEPRERLESGYSIRCQADWTAVYTQLQKARETYDGSKKGFLGRYKRGFRRLMDNSDSMHQAIRFVPNAEYISPVLAAVEVLLDVS